MMLADSYFEDPQNFIKIRPLRSFEQYLEEEKQLNAKNNIINDT